MKTTMITKAMMAVLFAMTSVLTLNAVEPHFFIGRASRESSLQSCGFQTLRVVWSQPVILKRSMLRMGMKSLSADGNSPVCPFLGTHRDRCVCTARRKS